MKKSLLLPLLASGACLAGTAMRGVTLVPGGLSGKTSILDSSGTAVHTWSSVSSPYSAFLTDSGSLVYSTGSGTGPGAPYKTVSEVDWSGNALHSWTWTSPTTGTLHHALSIMPNGHYLASGYEYLSNSELKTAMGVSSLTYTGSIYSEHVIEYDPASATVVWEWDAKDHFSTTNDPRKINVNNFASSSSGGGPTSSGSSSGDLLHFNSVVYDPVRDVVLISAHMLNEILVVDHSTTTEEAATTSGGNFNKGGGILFRWGSAGNYGGSSSTVCNVVHGANTIPEGSPGAGNYLFFCNSDNGVLNSSAKSHSVAYEIEPVVADTGFVIANGEFSSSVAWNWFRNASDYSSYASSGNYGFVQRLPNGNSFISFSKQKRLVEVDSTGEIVLMYTGCNAENVRATRYPLSFSGIANLNSLYEPDTSSSDTTASDTTEDDTTTTAVSAGAAAGIHLSTSFATRTLEIRGLAAGSRVRVLDLKGRVLAELADAGTEATVSTRGWANGTYVVDIQSAGVRTVRGLALSY